MNDHGVYYFKGVFLFVTSKESTGVRSAEITKSIPFNNVEK